MDKKQLEEKLSQVVEWVYPSVSRDNSIERVIPANGGEYAWEYKPKPDLGPRVVSIKHLAPCEWCGKILNHRKSVTKVITAGCKTPKWHWACYNCKRVWDPNTCSLQPLQKTRKKSAKLNTSADD